MEPNTYTLEDVKKLKADLSRSAVTDLLALVTESGDPAHPSTLLCSLLEPLCALYGSASNFQLKVATCDALATWTTRAIGICRNGLEHVKAEIVASIQRGSYFTFFHRAMLDDWDLGVPIHGPVRELFTKALKLQEQLDPKHKVEQSNLLRTILQMSLTQKSVYYSIEILRKFLGTQEILQIEPNFFERRLRYMGDLSISTPLGRLLAAVMIEPLGVNSPKADQVAWAQQWMSVVAKVLLTGSAEESTSIMTYLLPRLFQASETGFLGFMSHLKTSEINVDQTRRLYVLLTCLRRAKESRIIEDLDSANLDKVGLKQQDIETYLTHANAPIRIAALELLVSHPKTTTPFSQTVFITLKKNLWCFFGETDMQYRKETMDAFRSFFIRFQASLNNTRPLLKKAVLKQDARAQEAVSRYIHLSVDFARWLVTLLKSNLEPGNGFQITYMSLQTLQLISGLGWHSGGAAVCERFTAFRKTALSQAETMATLPFDPILFDDEMIQLLVGCLGDPFDDNRTLAISVLDAIPLPMAGLDSTESLIELYRNADKLLLSVRGRDGDGGARVIQFIFQRFILTGFLDSHALTDTYTHTTGSHEFHFMKTLLHSISVDVEVGLSNMLLVAQDRSIHGRLSALRYILEGGAYESLPVSSHTDQWRELHVMIVQAASNIWQLVKEVLCDDSPEGSLPISVNEQQSTESQRGPETQVVLSFCWRALREISSLLRTLVCHAPHSKEHDLMADADYERIGILCLSWLTEVRHRGAFSAVFPNFVDITKALLSMQQSAFLSGLPFAWLEANLETIKSPLHSKDITRRSGGLPMSIISIMIASYESDLATSVDIFSQTMQNLIGLVTQPVNDVTEKSECPQVHGLNTLKDIFLESRLASCSINYIEQCFVISIDGFSSPLWAIRNCSMMLFTALIRRSFGSKLSRKESNTRTYSIHAFFNRYPKVLTRLTRELQTAVSELFNKETPVVTTGLHPCLTLLTRLDLGEDSDPEDYQDLENLQNLVAVIATSQIWQVRSMAAQAIPTFVEPELVGSFIVQQITAATTSDQNALHGRLLMIHHLLQYNFDRYTSDRIPLEQIIGDLRRAILSKMTTFSSDNPCAITEAAWLRILLFLARTTKSQDNIALRQRVVDYCARHIAMLQEGDQQSIGSGALAEIMTKIILRALADPDFQWLQSAPTATVLRSLLDNANVDVRLTVYHNLASIFKDATVLSSSILHKALQDKILVETWSVSRIAAKSCLMSLPNSLTMPDHQATTEAMANMLLQEIELAASATPDVSNSLILLGRYMNALGAEFSERFLRVAYKFTSEDVQLETRISVLRAIEASGLLQKGKSNDSIPLMSPILLELLMDDDEDVRQLCSGLVCDHLLLCPPQVPEHTRSLLIGAITSAHSTSSRLQRMLLNDIVGPQNPEEIVRAAFDTSNFLFAVEKQNLWRNPVIVAAQAISGLDLMQVDSIHIETLEQWAYQILSKVVKEVKVCKATGHLGWSSVPDIWQLVKRASLVVAYLDRQSSCSAELIQGLKDKLGTVMSYGSGAQLHVHMETLKIENGSW